MAIVQNYIVEIVKHQNGEYAHEVFWAWDEDSDKAMLKAESKYHEILSRASVSTYAEHAAILFTSEGFPVMHQCYKHAPEPEPEDVPSEDDHSDEGEE